MKKWNSAVIEELTISETAQSSHGIHSDGGRSSIIGTALAGAQIDSATCQNKNQTYWTVYGTHQAHPDMQS